MHELITIVAKDVIIVSIALFATVFLWVPKKLRKEFLLTAIIAAVASYALAKLGSHLFYDPRPFVKDSVVPYFGHGNDNGFPSDHTLFASFMAAVALRYHKTAGIILAVFAVAIGASRVIAGVHHGIDIIGAMIFAAAGTLLAISLTHWILPRHKLHHEPAPSKD